MELQNDIKEELIRIIEKASTGAVELTNREMAMLLHWTRHINDKEYAWVPEEYKKDMPQYRGNR